MHSLTLFSSESIDGAVPENFSNVEVNGQVNLVIWIACHPKEFRYPFLAQNENIKVTISKFFSVPNISEESLQPVDLGECN